MAAFKIHGVGQNQAYFRLLYLKKFNCRVEYNPNFLLSITFPYVYYFFSFTFMEMASKILKIDSFEIPRNFFVYQSRETKLQHSGIEFTTFVKSGKLTQEL